MLASKSPMIRLPSELCCTTESATAMLTTHAGMVTRILTCSNGGYSNAWQFSEHRQSLTVLSVEPEMM